MKAQELRIGNIVYEYSIDASGNKAANPHEFLINNAYTLSRLSEHAEGIPLTEEWLLKFGLEKYHGMWQPNYLKSNNPGLIYIELFENDKYHLSGPDAGKSSVSIDYVHQLQNLHFALTGKELTLK